MQRQQAVVIGASIAGLVAARALANHFQHVIIVERDGLNDATQPRKGVPQANHVHILLTGGLNVLQHYFPSFTSDMHAAGVPELNWSRDLRWFQAGSWKTRQPCSISFYPQARVDLESRIREYVRQHPKIEFRSQTKVEQLLFDASKTSVTGVLVRHDEQTSELNADLVVDTTGRGSRTSQWLEAAGYQTPVKEVMPIDLVYVSQIFKKTDTTRDWQSLACHPSKDSPRGAIIAPIDDEHWIVTLFGYLGQHPTPTNEGVLEYVKQLPIPDIYTTLAEATPVSEPIRFGYPQQVLHHYEKLKRFPQGFLVLGDALCSVDPVFGQGMTLACKEAHALDQVLASAQGQQAATVAQAFFKQAQKIIEVPWLITQAEALRFKGMPGSRSPKIRFLQWYTEHVFWLSAQSTEIYQAFLDVMHLLAGPEALLRPKVVRGVLGRMFGRA
ncbi:FAD-dependent oxidoreductase [Herpetosiphon llansteffanensis]|uniref:FAD-dependent oxidoreductase n=1 Tax=Herpetosiphon llansteffanensis TaxID=2094568 RepID=UPI000D7C6947|nr:FAD-dependent monooxygenase [Herpetosiphon llansteffanensis]